MARNESVVAELRFKVEQWRDKAVRFSLAGPTANGQIVATLRYCAGELEPLIAQLAAHTDSCTGTASGVPKTENVSGTADVSKSPRPVAPDPADDKRLAEMDDVVSPRWSVGSG